MAQCKAKDCTRSADRAENGRSGFCSMHYQRFKKFGDPNFTKGAHRPALNWIDKHKTHQADDCLKWPFHIGTDGYGRIHDPDRGGRLTTAARYMLTQSEGEPPTEGHQCAHACGQGRNGCVNPSHLYWATRSENEADKIGHQTTCRGENNGSSKLTRHDVIEIRELAKTQTKSSIATKFGVSRSQISGIVAGKQWSWLNPKS